MQNFDKRLAENDDPLIMGVTPITKAKRQLEEHKNSTSSITTMMHGNPSPVQKETKLQIPLSQIEDCDISDRALIDEPSIQTKKLAPKQKWQKAIRKVIFLGKFGLLSKDLKIQANLFGHCATNQNKLNKDDPNKAKKCSVIIYIYIYIIYIYIYIYRGCCYQNQHLN